MHLRAGRRRLTVVEELPELIGKGRRRVELQLGTPASVGRFVVDRSQRESRQRLDGLLGNGTAATPQGTATAPRTRRHLRPVRTGRPDPAADGDRRRALADYDTLSASQVVRRLESLGPEELQAVQRYEASTRNRRTILNRAGQLLESGRGPSNRLGPWSWPGRPWRRTDRPAPRLLSQALVAAAAMRGGPP